MSPSAAQPIYTSYTAGSCRLDVSFTPLALSQWTARPIADALTFQLWLGETSSENADERSGLEKGAEVEQRVLVAEGDRTQLEAIAQYFQSRTRRVLVLSNLHSSERTTENPDSIQLPDGLQLSKPLGYLQLCDVMAVLSQYEQATKTLPFSLAETVNAISESDTSDISNNVISLDAVRRVERSEREPEHLTARRTRPSSARRGWRKTGMWASSAAAALFVVGLTTTLSSRDPSLQDLSVVSESHTPDRETAPYNDGALSGEPSETAADLEAAGERDDLETGRENPSDVASNENSSTINANRGRDRASGVSPGRTSRERTDEAPTEHNRTTSPLPDSASSSQGTADTEESAATDRQFETIPPVSTAQAERTNPNREANSETADSPEADVPAQSTEGEPEAAIESVEDDGDRTFSPPASDLPPASTSGGASRGSADADSESSAAGDLEGNAGSSPELPSAVLRRVPAPASGSDPSAPESSQPEAPPEVLPEVLRAPAPPRPPSAPDVASSAPAPEMVLKVGLQIQSYFQPRWQGDDAGPLTYTLQLSETGVVNSFVALDERSQAYRDRLLSADNPPIFEVDGGASSRAFRVVFGREGTVEVTPL